MQSFVATVVSSKTPQTVSVEFSYFKKHPKYQKILKRNTKLLAHNEIAGINVGDTVRIVKSRPYSKLKHFLVTEIITKKAVDELLTIKSKSVEKKTEVKEVKKVEDKKTKKTKTVKK